MVRKRLLRLACLVAEVLLHHDHVLVIHVDGGFVVVAVLGKAAPASLPLGTFDDVLAELQRGIRLCWHRRG